MWEQAQAAALSLGYSTSVGLKKSLMMSAPSFILPYKTLVTWVGKINLLPKNLHSYHQMDHQMVTTVTKNG